MVNFSIHNDQAINDKIEEDLNFIRGEILNKVNGVKSLILVGGFGRGEGSVLIENERGIPVNDYDIVMITDNARKSSEIKAVKNYLAENLEVEWIDIKNMTEKDLKNLKLSIYNYDLKYGSYVFHGDKEILSLIPDMEVSKIPSVEGEILFFTRMWCFLGPFSTKFLKRELTEDEKFFLANQMSKALLACIDVKLLLKSDYHHSYRERLSRILKITENETLQELFKWAVDFKLKPKKNIKYDVIDLYFKIKTVYFSMMKGFLQKFYNNKFDNWNDYAYLYKWNFRKALKRIGYLIIRRNLQMEKRININLAQLFIAAAYLNNGVNHELFQEGLRYFNKVARIDHNISWEEARKLVAELRMKI